MPVIADPKTARELLGRSLEQPMVFFTGAGVSRRAPASLPVNLELLNTAANILLETVRDPKFGDAREASLELAATVPGLPLEHFLELLIEASGPGAIDVMRIFAGGLPNADHGALAALWRRAPHWLFTLNFDLLHEAAIRAMTGAAVRTVATLAEFKAARAVLQGPPTVYHLHGVLDDVSGAASISTTLASIRTRLHTSRARLLRAAVEEHDVLCLGYSNGDIDTFPIIAAGQQRIFWYHHEGALPPQLANPSPEVGRRLVVLHRMPEEEGILEVLRNTRPDFLPPSLKPNVEVEDSASRLRRFGDSLVGFIDGTGNRQRAVRFMLASLAADRGRYELAITLLKTPRGGPTPAPHLATQEQLLLGHCCELAGRQTAANRVFAGLQREASVELRGMTRLNRASAALGDWKLNPLKIWRLARWLWTIWRLRDASSQAIQHRRTYEVGDVFQFLGERFLVPSAAMAVWRPHSTVRVTRVLRVAETISLRGLGGLRRQWLRRGALSYLKMVRRARTSPVDPATGFTILAQLRAIECAVSLSDGRVPLMAAGWMDEAEAYYRWAHSRHGLGNVSCTRGIVAMRSSRFSEAGGAFQQALERYGDHAAGIRKVAFCRWRLAITRADR